MASNLVESGFSILLVLIPQQKFDVSSLYKRISITKLARKYKILILDSQTISFSNKFILIKNLLNERSRFLKLSKKILA